MQRPMNKDTAFPLWLSVVSILLFASCSGVVERNQETAYSVITPKFRIQSSQKHSINEDIEDREDYVKTAAFLIFPSGRTERVGYSFATSDMHVMPSTKVLAGKNDIYIFANVPETEVKGLVTRSSVEDYMLRKTSFDQWTGVGASAEYGFRMSRVYYNQNIPAGYTETNPYEWKPQIDPAYLNSPLAPVSQYGQDVEGGVLVQRTVGLVRACAKITLSLTGEGVPEISEVTYHSAVGETSLRQLPEGSFATEIPQRTITLKAGSSAQEKRATLYVPERLYKGASPQPRWNKTSDIGEYGVTYITIKMKSGKLYRFPIVRNETKDIVGVPFLQFAKGEVPTIVPDYAVVRNFHYNFNVSVPVEDKELNVSLRVLPWTLIESERSFKRPEYSFKIYVVDKGTSFDTVDSMSPIDAKDISKDVLLPPGKEVIIKFSVKQPRGAIWVSSITNGLFFKLEGEGTGVVVDSDIVGSAPEREYKMRIKPLAEFETEPRYTQFFIAIGGKEIDLSATGKEDCRYIGEGANDRWKIKQVMN